MSQSPNKVELGGVVVAQGPQALLFFDDESVQEVWISRRLIFDWWFTDSSAPDATLPLEVDDLERNDEITIVIPRWLAEREGLA